MSNEIAELPVGDNLLPVAVSDTATDEAFKDAAASSQYLPRFTLYGANSGAVKEDKIQSGRYGFNQGTAIVDCGKEVQVIVCGLRLKALEIAGDNISAFFNPKSEGYQRIQALSEVKDSDCLCGPEFLLYLPTHQQFVTFYMASKTMKKEAPNLRALLGKGATLKATLLKKQKYVWHGPVITPCSMALTLPDPEKLKVEQVKFTSESDSEVVAAPGTAAPARER